jgi:hypothetical protein
MVLANLAATFGTGLFVTGGPLFFTRFARLSVADLSMGLTVAGLIGLATSLPVGLLADRYGARGIAALMFFLRALGIVSFLAVDSRAGLMAAGAVTLAAERGGQAVFGALVAVVGGEDRVGLRAYLRSVTNVGVALGAGASAALIAVGSAPAYIGLILLDAAVVLLAGLLIAGTSPRRVPCAASEEPWLPVLRDVPYLAAALVHAVLSLSYEVLSFALPLWVATMTRVPVWVVPLLVILNTVLVVTLQVPASRGVTGPQRAALVARRGGYAFAMAAVLIGLTAGVPTALAVALLVVAVVVLTGGELWHAAASFALSFDLADQGAHGQYQAVYAMGEGLERALAPLVLGALCLDGGTLGWLALAAIFAVAGTPLSAVVRASAHRTAPQITRRGRPVTADGLTAHD